MPKLTSLKSLTIHSVLGHQRSKTCYLISCLLCENWKKLCHPDNVFGDSFFSLISTDKCYLWEEVIAQWPGYELVSVSLSKKKIADLTVKYNTFTHIKGMFTKKK